MSEMAVARKRQAWRKQMGDAHRSYQEKKAAGMVGPKDIMKAVCAEFGVIVKDTRMSLFTKDIKEEQIGATTEDLPALPRVDTAPSTAALFSGLQRQVAQAASSLVCCEKHVTTSSGSTYGNQQTFHEAARNSKEASIASDMYKLDLEGDSHLVHLVRPLEEIACLVHLEYPPDEIAYLHPRKQKTFHYPSRGQLTPHVYGPDRDEHSLPKQWKQRNIQQPRKSSGRASSSSFKEK